MGKIFKKLLFAAMVVLSVSGVALPAIQSASQQTVHAASTANIQKPNNSREQGVDWAKYQGANGIFGYAHDKFSIAQLGGYTAQTGLYDQWTYKSQVQSTIAQGKRAHTYIWWENVYNKTTADKLIKYTLDKVQTPKGSIIAIDFEHGANAGYTENTNLIKYAMQRFKDAGYTPMLYGYLGYLRPNVNLQSVMDTFGTCFWFGEYPSYAVTPIPNYGYFPSHDGIGVFQFTSTYIAGGLDGDVDLTGITYNGYTGNSNPKTHTDAINQGKKADNTPKKKITDNYMVKVNFSANKWSNGVAIPSWVKGKSYKVIQTNGNKVLLSGVMSWIDKSNVEILQTANQAQPKPKPVVSNIVLPAGVHREDGTFTPNRALSIWHHAGYGNTGVKYYNGESIHYQGYIRNGQWLYVAYHAYGQWYYVACRENGVPLGNFK